MFPYIWSANGLNQQSKARSAETINGILSWLKSSRGRERNEGHKTSKCLKMRDGTHRVSSYKALILIFYYITYAHVTVFFPCSQVNYMFADHTIIPIRRIQREFVFGIAALSAELRSARTLLIDGDSAANFIPSTE